MTGWSAFWRQRTLVLYEEVFPLREPLDLGGETLGDEGFASSGCELRENGLTRLFR